MSHARNAALIVIFLLVWIFLYVPNPYVSFLDIGEKSAPSSNDLLLFWVPAFLGAVAYVLHAGRWPIRLGLAIAPPVFIAGIIFLLGVTGVMPKEDAGWTLIFVMFPMRAFVVTLAITVAIVEVANRLRKAKNPKESSLE
ncbi:MAG: hypothetical protein HYY78_03205 [Betaproteobacteria bacterium]|nr:hypothetical protein [Betaproteobacteria bacterium]